jgi:hypothetical protein
MVSDWARQTFPTLAPAVRVPVHFSIAEYEKVWQADASAVQEITAMFSAVPRFTVHRQPEAGHNISLGHTAAEYHAEVLAFAEECMATSSNVTPQSLSNPSVTAASRSEEEEEAG